MTRTWVVRRVWRVEADTAVEAIRALHRVRHHRVEAIDAELCPHPASAQAAWPDHVSCPDCGRTLAENEETG